jgi:hypothetical protein
VMSETQTVRHDPERLATVVIGVIDEQIARRASYMKFKPAPAVGERPETLRPE